MDRNDFFLYKKLDIEFRAAAHSYLVEHVVPEVDPRSIEISMVTNKGGGMATIIYTCNLTDLDYIHKDVKIDTLVKYANSNNLSIPVKE